MNKNDFIRFRSKGIKALHMGGKGFLHKKGEGIIIVYAAMDENHCYKEIIVPISHIQVFGIHIKVLPAHIMSGQKTMNTAAFYGSSAAFQPVCKITVLVG